MSGPSYREDEEILETFVLEMQNRLEDMEADLELFAPGVAPHRETVDRLFRAAHSLKASANLLKFRNIESITHVMETVLDAMRWGGLLPGKDTLAALTKGMDALHDLLDNLEDSDAMDMGPTLALIGKTVPKS